MSKTIWSLLLLVFIAALMLIYGTYSNVHATTSYTFSGVLKDAYGSNLSGIKVTLRDASSNSFSSTTPTNGAYSIVVPEGMYSLQVSATNSNVLGAFSYSQPISTPSINLMSSNVIQNITLPVVSMDTKAYNMQGYLAGSSADLRARSATNSGSLPISLYTGSTDAVQDGPTASKRIDSGTGIIRVLAGTKFSGADSNNGVCSYNHSSGALIYCNSSPLTVTSNTSVDIPNSPSPRNNFTGFLRDQNGNALSNVTITLRDAYSNSVSASTSGTGNFTVAVQPGSYSLAVTAWLNTNLGSFSLAQPISSPSINLTTGNLTQNLTLPLATVSFTAYDALGNLASQTNTKVRAEASTSSDSSPVSLYEGAPNFTQIEKTTTNGWVTLNAQGAGSFKTIVGTKFTGAGSTNGICSYTYPQFTLITCSSTPLSVIAGTNTASIRVRPATPSGLSATTPTSNPVLSWESVTSATHYTIYRNGNQIGTSTSNSYTDNNVGSGSYNYQVSSVDTHGTESYLSTGLNVVIAQTTPVLSTPTFSANPIFKGQSSIVTTNIIGNLYGVIAGEYYLGSADPGIGQGIPMTYGNGIFTSAVSGLDAGTYSITFRAQNNIGWGSVTSADLTVVKPTFSGILKDSNGTALNNVSITLQDINGNPTTINTGSEGEFSLSVNPGLYSLKIAGNNITGIGNFSYSQLVSAPSIDLTTTNIVQDLTLPVATINFTAYNAQGYPAHNVLVKARASTTSGSLPISLYPGATYADQDGALLSKTIDANSQGSGNFKTIVGANFTGSDSLNGICSYVDPSVALINCNASSYIVTSGTNTVSIPLAASPTNILSGVLKDQNNTAIPDITITLRDTYDNSVSGVTDLNGNYSIPVQPGMYSMAVTAWLNSNLGSFSVAQPISTPTINLTSGNVTQDLILPVANVNFSTFDELGNPASQNNTKVRAAASKSSGSDPISLYAGGPDFTQAEATTTNGWVNLSTQGTGSFKTLIGTKFTGTGATNGVCSYTHPQFTLITCSTTALTVGTGTNSLIISAAP